MASSILTKLIIILIALVILLQILHMILLYQLESIKITNYANTKDQNYFNLKQLELDRHRMTQKIKNSHILDASGHYHIINSLLSNNLNSNFESIDYDNQDDNQQKDNQLHDLTLITQCSSTRLYYLVDLLNYHGPISLSIFTLSKDIPQLMSILILLRKCLPTFREYVKVNLVYPLESNSFQIKLPNINLNNLSCLTVTHQLASLRKHKDEFKVYGEDKGVQYPINLLRNIARKNADTNYILVLDIDLVPSRSLRNDFNRFIKQNTFTHDLKVSLADQIVFVLPTYEMDINIGINLGNMQEEQQQDNVVNNVMNNEINNEFDSIENENEFKNPHHLGMNLGNIVGKNFGTFAMPTNKSELLKLMRRRLVRPFYYELCFKCQKSTNYDEWQLIDYERQLDVLFEIFWQDPYEPFYIAKNAETLPYYDERFKQYGFNRISQVCELHIVGYRFFVLNNHFLVHKGFKKQDKFHDDKDIELDRNRLLFRQFKNELKVKYSASSRRCY